MRLLTNLLRKFRRDEIIGLWHTDDGSGFMIIMGSWIEFRRDGSGNYESWASGEEETSYHYKEEFKWVRLDRDTINIQEASSAESDSIKYKIIRVHGKEQLSSYQKQVGNPPIPAFWHFAQVLYRIR